MSIQDLPELPRDEQRTFEETVEKVRELAAKLKADRLGRFTQAYSSAAPAAAAIAPRPRQSVEVYVPITRASLVVGPQGETLKRLEKMSGATIALDLTYTNSEEKRFLVTGLPEDIDEAKRLIIDRPLNFSNYPTINISVPQVRIGLIIGKGGETIREIQEKSGAKVLIAPDMVNGSGVRADRERVITLMGEQPAIDRARDMIEEIVFGVVKSGASACLNTIRNSAIMQIPDAATGAVIGKKAETMKSIQSWSGAKLFIDPQPIPGTALRNVYISGPPENLASAQQLITDVIRKIDPTFGQYYPGYDMGMMSMMAASATGTAPGVSSTTNTGMSEGQPAAMDPAMYAAYMAQYCQQAGIDPSQYYQQLGTDPTQYYQQLQQAGIDPSQYYAQQMQMDPYTQYYAQYAAASGQQYGPTS